MSSVGVQYVVGAIIAALAVWGLVALAGVIRRFAANKVLPGQATIGVGEFKPPSESEIVRIQQEAREGARRSLRLHLAEHLLVHDGRADKPELRYARVKDALELADELLEQNQARPIAKEE